MSYIHPSIQKAIDYIEKNLNEPLDLNEISKEASYSPFHFSRIFKQATGETINNMIKRLRLVQSTHNLMYQNSSITHIGLDVGYETPSSFNKAFKQHFKVSPSEYKQNTKKFLENNLQHLENEPQIINIDENIYTYFDRSLGEYNDAAIDVWNKLIKEVDLDEIAIKFYDKKYFGLCYDNPNITEFNKMRYEACISISDDEKNIVDPKKIKILPKGKYAIFKHVGNYEDLYDVWSQFYSWIYQKGFELDNFPPIEEYLDNPKDILYDKTIHNTTNLMLKLDNI